MDSEIKNLFKVWITIFASLTFCHFIVRRIPHGTARLISILPIIALFSVLPLNLSSIHFVGITSFFITWLANFKLLLFAFNQGPLASNPNMSLLSFISLACLPIKIKQDLHPQTPQNAQNKNDNRQQSNQTTQKGLKSPFNYSIKFLLLVLVIHMYNYTHHMNQYMKMVIYCSHVYLAAEAILAMTAAPARALLGIELEPQFEEPYLSTSLQDFWGRRWNLMVPSILRPTVHEPVRSILTPVMGRNWALHPAVVATFLVSGLMHELLFFYQSHEKPTWEVTWFFVIHGICVSLEITIKKALAGKWQMHPGISRLLTIGFLAVTAYWLFFPQLLRNDAVVKVVQEYGILIQFVKDKVLKPLRLM